MTVSGWLTLANFACIVALVVRIFQMNRRRTTKLLAEYRHGYSCGWAEGAESTRLVMGRASEQAVRAAYDNGRKDAAATLAEIVAGAAASVADGTRTGGTD